MRLRYWLALFLLLPGLVSAQPPVRLTATTEKIHVEYQSGLTDFACTVFTSRTEKDGDAPYAPRHCWFVDKQAGHYDDTWVWIKPDGGEWEVQALLYDTSIEDSVGPIGASNVAVVTR